MRAVSLIAIRPRADRAGPLGALPTVSRQWVSYHRRGSFNDGGSAIGSRLLRKGEGRERDLSGWHG